MEGTQEGKRMEADDRDLMRFEIGIEDRVEGRKQKMSEAKCLTV